MSKKQEIKSTIKSADTEEWLDVVFTRPIGYAWTLLFKSLGVHPNVVTVISMVLGAASGVFFAFDADSGRGILMNVIGVLLLMWANFYDSADGQLARLTGQKTRLGRILDGAAGDIWFISIYAAIALRLFDHYIPFTSIEWQWWSFLLCAVAGMVFHARQSALADYYRNIHLYFLKGVEGSELDNSTAQKEMKDSLPKLPKEWFAHLFYANYYVYCLAQEKSTPQFQSFYAAVKERYPNPADIPQAMRNEFRRGSLPLMKWTNALTFNWRAIVCYISCFANIPWLYPLLEITVFAAIYTYMHVTHERLCKTMEEKMLCGAWGA